MGSGTSREEDLSSSFQHAWEPTPNYTSPDHDWHRFHSTLSNSSALLVPAPSTGSVRLEDIASTPIPTPTSQPTTSDPSPEVSRKRPRSEDEEYEEHCTKKIEIPLQDNDTAQKPNDDGYRWRKYGRKSVKGNKFPRSYYKCTYPGCQVKKQVEVVMENNRPVMNTLYKGNHEHDPPLVSHSRAGDQVSFRNAVLAGFAKFERALKNSSGATANIPRLVVETDKDVNHLDDGYRWRKYGQKHVKGSKWPRSYYKCAEPECQVKKQVDQLEDKVVNTYEGSHNHIPPPSSNILPSDTLEPSEQSSEEEETKREKKRRRPNLEVMDGTAGLYDASEATDPLDRNRLRSSEVSRGVVAVKKEQDERNRIGNIRPPSIGESSGMTILGPSPIAEEHELQRQRQMVLMLTDEDNLSNFMKTERVHPALPRQHVGIGIDHTMIPGYPPQRSNPVSMMGPPSVQPLTQNPQFLLDGRGMKTEMAPQSRMSPMYSNNVHQGLMHTTSGMLPEKPGMGTADTELKELFDLYPFVCTGPDPGSEDHNIPLGYPHPPMGASAAPGAGPSPAMNNNTPHSNYSLNDYT